MKMETETIGRCFSRISILCLICIIFVSLATSGAATAYAKTLSDEPTEDEPTESENTLPFLYIPLPPSAESLSEEQEESLPFIFIPPPPTPGIPAQAAYETAYESDGTIDGIPYVKVLDEVIPLARCDFKSWMDFRAIRTQNSRQWRMQQIAYTCEDGFRRVDGMYMIAIGTYFLEHGVGDVFEITLSSGVSFRAVIGDIKDNRHTDPTNRFNNRNGSVLEFIVDRQVMSRDILSTGNIAFAGFPGYVVSMKRLPELFVSV